MGALIPPCKGCEKRLPGCHGSCEAYKAFRVEWEKYKAWEKLVRPKPKTAWMLKWIRRKERGM